MSRLKILDIIGYLFPIHSIESEVSLKCATLIASIMSSLSSFVCLIGSDQNWDFSLYDLLITKPIIPFPDCAIVLHNNFIRLANVRHPQVIKRNGMIDSGLFTHGFMKM